MLSTEVGAAFKAKETKFNNSTQPLTLAAGRHAGTLDSRKFSRLIVSHHTPNALLTHPPTRCSFDPLQFYRLRKLVEIKLVEMKY